MSFSFENRGYSHRGYGIAVARYSQAVCRMDVVPPTKAMIKVKISRSERFSCCKATYPNALTANLTSQVASLLRMATKAVRV
uniref:Uncharacterized protein n=1 Tax=Panagrellus redivivus TaxID=6233 RepID=A0A7E4ZQC3_PANRE